MEDLDVEIEVLFIRSLTCLQPGKGVSLGLIVDTNQSRLNVLPQVLINVDQLAVKIMVVALRHVAQVPSVLSVRVIVCELGEEEATQ